MTRHLGRGIRWLVFTVLMILALIGLALPVVPQIPFFIGALIVIMPESRWVRKKYIQWRRRHPRFFHAMERWRRERQLKRLERLLQKALRRSQDAVEPVVLALGLGLGLALAGALASPAQAQAGDAVAVHRALVPADDAKITIHAKRAGWFSSLGHDHVIAATRFAGGIAWTGKPETSSVTLTVDTTALEVLDPGVSAGDKAEIAESLRSKDVLDVKRHPEIVFRSTAVKVTSSGIEVTGELTLRGKTRPVKFPVTLDRATLAAKGTVTIKQTDFGIEPFGVGLGAVKVADEVSLEFSLVPRS